MFYDFEIKTADQYCAGTDSNIFLILYGEFGQSDEIRLNGYIKGNAFERNQTDKCSIDLTNIGRVFSIRLRSDCKYAGSGWNVSYIKITRKGDSSEPDSNLPSQFDINAWIENIKAIDYTIPFGDWIKNLAKYETLEVEYKTYKFNVPPNSTYEFTKTEKTTTGFQYTNATTKKLLLLSILK